MPHFQSRVSRATLVLLIAFLLAALGFSVGVYGALRVFGPGPLNEAREIVIERGSSIEDIAQQLASEGIIRRWWPWAIMARLGVNPNHIKAGEYLIPPAVSAWGALDIIRRGDVIIRKLTIPEGLTSYQIVELVRAHPKLRGKVETIPPEGSLLPETYYFQGGDERTLVLQRMQTAMLELKAELWPQRAPEMPLQTMQEVMTLASIVEKETGWADERARVAGVFFNRLRKGMPLQSDPTTIYALTGGKGSIQDVLGRQLRRSDWRLNHPYNTYAVRGLPPGPIANPGRASIMAVLKPERHNYLFFVATLDGHHRFAASYAEHNKNIALYRVEQKEQQKIKAQQEQMNSKTQPAAAPARR